eukprot:5069173-Pleurochrysis_carterae.AAC.2
MEYRPTKFLWKWSPASVALQIHWQPSISTWAGQTVERELSLARLARRHGHLAPGHACGARYDTRLGARHGSQKDAAEVGRQITVVKREL